MARLFRQFLGDLCKLTQTLLCLILLFVGLIVWSTCYLILTSCLILGEVILRDLVFRGLRLFVLILGRQWEPQRLFLHIFKPLILLLFLVQALDLGLFEFQVLVLI